jgi:hypothetical protein
VGGGGPVVGQVAQVILDLPEGLRLGEVDEAFSHVAENLLTVGSQAGHEVLDAGLAVGGGGASGRCRGVVHGAHPGKVPLTEESNFPTPHDSTTTA